MADDEGPAGLLQVHGLGSNFTAGYAYVSVAVKRGATAFYASSVNLISSVVVT